MATHVKIFVVTHHDPEAHDCYIQATDLVQAVRIYTYLRERNLFKAADSEPATITMAHEYLHFYTIEDAPAMR